MNTLAQSTWRCRICGQASSIQSKECMSCSEPRPARSADMRALLAGGVVAQVLNPNAGIVYNNVYNFAQSDGDVTVMTPQQVDRTAKVLGRWTEDQPEQMPERRPVRSFGASFFLGFLRMVTIVSLMIILGVILTVGTILVLGFIKP